jgi:hypothetical protein
MAIYISNLIIYTHVDFEQTFILSEDNNLPLNLNGYNAASTIKRHGASSPLTIFTTSFPDRENGKVRVSLGSTQTSQLKSGRYYYDLVLTNSAGTKTKVVEGEVFIKTAITR